MNFYRPTSDRVKLYSSSPILGITEDLLSEEECDSIIEIAKNKLEPSQVGSTTAASSTTRTSSSANIGNEEKVRKMISEKIKELYSFEENELESLQVVHYENGEKFDVHHDSAAWGGEDFDSGELAFSPIPRIATVLIYLNTVNEGTTAGEITEGLTVFPNVGYAVRPKKGRAVIFYNFTNEGIVDFASMHTGFPVNHGEKWALNAWIIDSNLDVSEYIDKDFVKKGYAEIPKRKAKFRDPDKLDIII